MANREEISTKICADFNGFIFQQMHSLHNKWAECGRQMMIFQYGLSHIEFERAFVLQIKCEKPRWKCWDDDSFEETNIESGVILRIFVLSCSAYISHITMAYVHFRCECENYSTSIMIRIYYCMNESLSIILCMFVLAALCTMKTITPSKTDKDEESQTNKTNEKTMSEKPSFLCHHCLFL